MPEKDNKILKYNKGEKSVKVPFIIYADLVESLLEKLNTCHNNPEKSSTTKINKLTPSGYSLFAHCLLDTTKNKLHYNRGKSCMKNFCLDLRKHVTKIIKYLKLEMTIKCHKVKDHCHYTGKYRGAAHDICSSRYKIQTEVPVVFHNGSTYDYHVIIKELAEECEGEFECLIETTGKYITFSVPIKKEITNKDKDGNEKAAQILYNIKFVDSYRFMSTSLSNLFNNLSDVVHNDKCGYC